jgi:hypothetical protein
MTVESSSPSTPRRYRRPMLCVFAIGLGIVSALLN